MAMNTLLAVSMASVIRLLTVNSVSSKYGFCHPTDDSVSSKYGFCHQTDDSVRSKYGFCHQTDDSELCQQ